MYFKLILSLLFLLSPSLAKADIITGLTAHWLLDEGSGTTASDSIGINNLVLSNITWATGYSGGYSIQFNGVDSQGNSLFPTGISGAAPRTITWWEKDASNGVMAGVSTAAIGGTFQGMCFNGGSGYNYYLHTYGGSDLNTGVACSSGWHFNSIWSDGVNIKYYVDGAEIGSGAYVPNTVDANLNVGYTSVASYPLNNGALIDDIRIYSRALSPADVLELYQSASSTAEVVLQEAVIGGMN